MPNLSNQEQCFTLAWSNLSCQISRVSTICILGRTTFLGIVIPVWIVLGLKKFKKNVKKAHSGVRREVCGLYFLEHHHFRVQLPFRCHLLKLQILVIQKAITPQNEIEFCQKSIGAISCRIATLFNDVKIWRDIMSIQNTTGLSFAELGTAQPTVGSFTVVDTLMNPSLAQHGDISPAVFSHSSQFQEKVLV